jgi:hypothetical protein
MKALACNVSYLEWMSSSTQRNSDGSPTTVGSSCSRMADLDWDEIRVGGQGDDEEM